MESASHASSEEELLKLREEGKISEKEYEELLGTMRRSPAGSSDITPPAEPQFQAFRKRILIGGFIISILGIVFGLILRLPLVWGLGIFGIIAIPLKYHLTNKHT
jgi:hypothetical protein